MSTVISYICLKARKKRDRYHLIPRFIYYSDKHQSQHTHVLHDSEVYAT